jgi:hypothetical protein
MRSQEVKDYIRERASMFWYSPEDKTETVTDELLVETILNYGSMDDVRQLLQVVDTKWVSEIFRGMTGRKKMNYFPEVWNYFDLYFGKYAS